MRVALAVGAALMLAGCSTPRCPDGSEMGFEVIGAAPVFLPTGMVVMPVTRAICPPEPAKPPTPAQ
jgi:hypothetical protein